MLFTKQGCADWLLVAAKRLLIGVELGDEADDLKCDGWGIVIAINQFGMPVMHAIHGRRGFWCSGICPRQFAWWFRKASKWFFVLFLTLGLRYFW
jgi:hypothetical protein